MNDANKKRGRPGLSKADWLEAGLDLIVKAGVGELTIEKLARSLKISKSGFYWHFKDRRELLDSLLEYWMHELTEVVSNNPKIIALKGKNRLLMLTSMIVDFDLNRYEMAFRHWALLDKKAAQAVKRVTDLRLDFLCGALSDLGFKGSELDMRARVFLSYLTLESVMYADLSKAQRKKMFRKQIEMLTKN